MTLDLLVRNATLPDGRSGLDIAARDGRIVAIEPGLRAEARETIDARGRLVSPPFVDCHFHLDATLSLGLPRLNMSGTLLEGIALWGELKPLLTHEAVAERALRYCDLAVSRGLLAIRTHVDVCDDRLLAVEALLEVKKQVRPYLDLQLVAFPQDGYFRSPNAREEPGARARSRRRRGRRHPAFRAHDGRRRGVGEGAVRDRRRSAGCRSTCIATRATIRIRATSRRWRRRRSGWASAPARPPSHATSMHSMDNYYVSKLIPLIAESGINVVANPLINITLQGRHDTYPRRRGLTRIPELRAAGVNVALGQDCVMDPWYGLGGADMLDVAHMAVHAVPMTSREAIAWSFAARHRNGRRASWASRATGCMSARTPISWCCRPPTRSRRCGCAPSGSASCAAAA